MDAKIHGTTLPMLEITLQPDESVISNTGELSWMTPNIQMQTGMQSGSPGGGMMGALRRVAGGGSLFLTTYTAQQGAGVVAFASRLPGSIFPVDIAPVPGSQFVGHRHSFLCATPGVTVGMTLQQRFGVGLFGGEGFAMLALGGQGRCWVELSGELLAYDLGPGQSMLVHPGHVGLFQDTVQFNITNIRGMGNRLLGQDGLYLAQLTGPGRIWLQSLTLDRLAQTLTPYITADQAGQRNS